MIKFENIRVPLNALYYMIYQCFLNRYSINKTYIEMTNFAEIMTISKISKNLIIKIYRELRNIINTYYHHTWSESYLGLEPAEGGKARIEIDESKVIGNQNSTIWMFILIDR